MPLTTDQRDALSLDAETADEVWAEVTGEFRPVRAGEWFVSGATPEAYQATQDMHATRLMDCRYIARLRWWEDSSPVVDDLVAAATAVVQRWHTPLWKNVPTTAIYIQRLERAVQSLGCKSKP